MKKLTHEEFMERVTRSNKYVSNGDLSILGEYVGIKIKIACKCNKHNYEWDASPHHLLEGQGCVFCGREENKISNEVFLERVSAINKNISPLDKYDGMKKQIRFQCNQGHIWLETPDNILRGRGCPYCSGRKVLKGFNDLNTTMPDITLLLKNPEDGYKYTRGSSKKIDFVCPDCNKIQKKRISDVCLKKFSCNFCGDGISYPEKFGRAFLNQLNIKSHISEYHPEWAEPYFYDDYFVYRENKYIVEWDGLFHYVERSFTKQTLSERQKVDNLKDEMANNHGIIILRIDCSFSNANYIKQNILNSELSNIFDLSRIDWELCDKQAQSNLVKNVCNLYASGETNLKFISEKVHLCESTVRSYLKRGNEIGWCNYDPKQAKDNAYNTMSKSVLWLDDTGNIVCEFKNAKMCEFQMEKDYNIFVKRSGIKWACQNNKPYKGFNFRYANDTVQN